jgi:NDP-sugar pyrophosphorylase family protein
VATQLRRERLNLGVLEVEGERVVAYHEKPERVERLGLGIYAVDPRALACLPDTGPVDMPEWIARLLAEGRPVFQYETDAPWFDLGSPEQYAAVLDRWPQLEERLGGRP